MEIVWLSICPICEFPGGVIHPLPDALLVDVVASKASTVEASSHQLIFHVLLNGICVYGGQMTSLFLTDFLSIIPVLRVTAEVEAVVTKNLPALIASTCCSWLSCWVRSWVAIARDCTLSVTAPLAQRTVRLRLTVGALAVRACVTICVSWAVVCYTSLLAVVATDSAVEVTDRANRSSVSAV